MHRIPFAWMTRGLAACLVACAVALVAVTAHADGRTEKEVQALQKKAIQEDFLNVDYPAAIKKLRTAVNKCGATKCSAPLRGSLLRDLGAMLILGGSKEEGKAFFVQALGADSTLELDPSYKNPDLEAAWGSAKKGGAPEGPDATTTAAGGGAAAAAAGGGAGAASAGGGASQPSGDFTHAPVAEQAVRTPIPIYVEYPGSEALKKVFAKYKAPGMTEWKPVELQKMGDGWGGLIPCKDLMSQGKVQYFLQGFNAANDPVATAGSRNKPYTVSLEATISGPEPSLPGQPPPKQCSELAGAECPPDFPGCSNAKKSAGEDCEKNSDCTSKSCAAGKCEEKKAGGDDCEKDDECSSGSCSDGKCKAAKKGAGEDCETSDECDSGECKEGKCEGGGGSSEGFRRIWVGVGGSLDLFFMPGANDVCALNSAGTAPLTSGNPYTCYDPTFNTNFPGSGGSAGGINAAILTTQNAPGNAQVLDYVSGGFAHGPITIFASLDYALNPNMMVGGRVGYELLTYPGADPPPAFPPLRIEARFTYLFGANAINKLFAPVVFVGAGAGEFDAYVPVTVTFGNNPAPPTSSPFGPGSVPENAWLTAGPVFATGGGGIRLALGGTKKQFALTGLVRVEAAFGGTAGFLFGVAPELGAQVGF